MLELKETEHEYYCEAWESDHIEEYNNWEEFVESGEYDPDYNLLFRFDIQKYENEDNENEFEFVLLLHHALQRHGIYLYHAVIHNIREENLKDISSFLKGRYNHLNKLWSEFSLENTIDKEEEYEY